MSPLEKDIETHLRRMVQRHGGMCLKWVCPGWGGVPDRIILLPGARVYFVELKRPEGGRVSRLQHWWRDTLQKLGFQCLHIRTHEGVKAFEQIINS